MLLGSLILYLVLCSWHFGGKFRKWNAGLCIPYPADWRLQGIYPLLHFKYWISYLFSMKISFIVFLCYWNICFRLRYRWSFFFVIESQNILFFNASCYYLQYNKTKYIVKGFISVYGEKHTNSCGSKCFLHCARKERIRIAHTTSKKVY